MFKNSTTQNHLFLFIALWLLTALISQPVALAAGSVEFHKINSKVLAAAGLPAEHELSVYLPPDYKTSQIAYPVVYLLPGTGGSNRTFFGESLAQYGRPPIHINQVADALIEQGKMKLVVIIGITIPRGMFLPSPWADYTFEEIIPFVDKNFRTIPTRTHRAISGWSAGGFNAVVLAFLRPDLFSVVGSYAGAFAFRPPQFIEELAEGYDAAKFPLRFWLWHGRNDKVASFAGSERVTEFLKGKGWEYIFEFDNGDHFTIDGPIERSLQYFSKELGKAQVITAVQPHGKLTTTWGEIKRSR